MTLMRKVSNGMIIFVLGILLIVFMTNIVIVSQNGLSAGSNELNQTNRVIGYITIFNPFFSVGGFLLAGSFIMAGLLITRTLIKGFQSKT